MKLADKFGLPSGLMDSVKKVFDESTEYQNKVKAHMAKKGIKSLGDLSPEEKKKFFKELDAMHTAKHEEANICPVCNKEPCECPTGNHIEEAVGGGTSVNTQSTKTAAAQKKRADVAVKIAALKLKQEKEREALQKQKASVKEEFDASVLDESFSPAMVAKLKAEYGKISTIDPSSDNYKKLIAMLDKMDKKDLQTLADAGIKFVSGLAKNRVNRMKNESVEESWPLGPDKNTKVKSVTMRHKTSGKEIVVVQPAVKEKEKLGFVVVKEEIEINEMDKSQPSSSRGAEGLPVGKKATPITTDKTKKDALKVLQQKYKKVKEEVEIEEGKSSTGYNLYHKDFSSAMAHAYDFAKNKYGIEVDPEEIDRKVAMGPKKPSSGKTNSYRLIGKDGKKAIQVQVANLDNKRYELNMYKEEVELNEVKVGDKVSFDHEMSSAPGKKVKKSGTVHKIEGDVAHIKVKDKYGAIVHKKKIGELQNEEVDLEEKVVKGKGYDNPENDRKAPEGKVPMTSLMPGHSDKAARFAAVQAKGRLVKGKAQSATQKEPGAKTEESNYQEFKQGGEALANKFEKAFGKMGIKTKIKMKTVGNISVNEAVMKKVKKAAKKMKEEAPSKNDVAKSGEPLSGKKEPIEINPEIQQSK